MSAKPFVFTRRRVTISFEVSDTTRLSAEDAARALQSSFDGTPGGYGYQTINRAVLDAFDDGQGITNQAVKCRVEVANLPE